MIECTKNFVWYKKNRKKSFKRFFILFFILVIIISLIVYYKKVVTETLYSICNDYAYACSSESLNSAVISSLSDSVKYNDVVKIDKNLSGDIVLISTDTHTANYISKKVTELTRESIKIRMKQGVPVPFLAFTGVGIISGYGKTVNLKTANVVSVASEYNSIFESVGINQTNHSLYIKVITTVSINIPLKKSVSVFESEILLAQSVLVGKVPEIYLNGSKWK